MYLIVILLVVVYFCYNERFKCGRYYRLMKKFPAIGLELPVLGSAWQFCGDSEALMKVIDRFGHEAVQLGGAARLHLFTFYYVVLADAHDTVFALKTSLEKDYIYKLLQTFSGNGSAFTSGPIAKERRAVLLPSFHLRLLHSFVGIFWEESVKLTETLAPHAGRGPFALEEYLQKYNFGTILRSGIVNASDIDSYGELFAVMRRWEMIAADRIFSFWKHPDCLYRLTSQYAEGRRIVNIGHHFAQKIINQRAKQIKSYNQAKAEQDTQNSLKQGIFDSIIHSHLGEEEKREEVLVVIIATDLVVFAIGFTLMLLGMYPEVQDRVYREIQDVFDTDRPVSIDDLSRLNYLEMVMKESMRLYPPVPTVARKVLKDVALPSGKVIPAGTGLFAAILGLHRNPKYWGPNADCFDPDRFSPERIATVPPEAYIPFSTGPRNCVGYKFGQISMKIVLSTILRKYRVVGTPAEGPVPNIRTKMGIYMRAENDFQIELVDRF